MILQNPDSEIYKIFKPVEIQQILDVKDAIFGIIESEDQVGPIWGPTFFQNDSSDVVIAGGLFPSLLLKEDIQDIDIFVLNENETKYNELVNRFFRHGAKKSKSGSFSPKNFNPYILESSTAPETMVNLILTKFKTRKALIENFDYLHCCVSMEMELKSPGVSISGRPSTQLPKWKLYISRNMFDAIKNKHLIVNNPDRCYSQREEKFKKRGWVVPLNI